jgi:uncharacterized membrane protein
VRPLSRDSLALLLIAVVGVLIAAYLTATHAESLPLYCSATAFLNCASVTHSAYSVILGTTIPTAAAGIVWFLFSGAASLLALIGERRGGAPGWLRLSHFLWALGGLVVVLYLVYVELVLLHQVCEWCTGVHLLVLATFLLTLRRLQTDVLTRSQKAGPAD